MVWVHLLHSNIMDGHIHISVVNNIHCGKKKIVAALALWVLFIVVPVDSATDPSDVKALGVLYNSLNSPSQLSNWKSNDNGDPCGESWKGISCSGSSVVSIQIQGLGLIGSLGYLLSNLLSLKTLDVSNNKIHDTIPYQVPPNLTHLNLASNNFSGNLPYSISAMTSLEYLNVGHNSLSQVIGDIFTNLHHLLTLDLSSNNFSGNLPKSLGDLSKLSTLHLQNNKLSGPVNVLANIHLSDLNIANNKFGGSIPKEFSSISNLRIEGNAFNNHLPPASHNHGHNNHAPSQRGSNVQNSQDGHFKHAGMGAPIICLISGVIVIALCTIMATLFCLRNKSKSNGVAEPKQKNNTTSISIGKDKGEWHQFSDYISSHAPTEWSFRPKELSSTQPSSSYQTEVTSKGTPEKTKHETSMADLKPPPGEKTLAAAKSYWGNESGNRAIKVPISATSYTVAALQSATNSFSQEYLIGEGSLGRVYKAEFSNGKVLAVKKIDCSSYIQEEDTFLETISSISKLKHQNITSLLGYCVEHGQRLLVYEYIGNGTLHDVLHYGDVHSEVISWTSRVKVALGTARALEYLHEVCLPSIVHKNLKSANVLLDEELNPHLSDCGLAVSMSNPERQVLTQAVGSFGYSAPEFVLSGVYTVNSDVYSLGVLMLELLTGRKPLDSSRVRSEQSLVRWAIPQLHDIDALSKMVDPLLNGIYPAKSLSQFADIVALCVQTEPEFRPPMSEVVQSLVRLAQKASIVKRLSGDELGFSHKILEFDQTGISTHI